MVDSGIGGSALYLRLSRAPSSQILHDAQRVQVLDLHHGYRCSPSKYKIVRQGLLQGCY